MLGWKQRSSTGTQVLGDLIGRWGQDMKALQWHSDDPMTYAMCCSKHPSTGQQLLYLLLYTIYGTILVSWEWCVEVEAGPSIVSASVWRLLIGRWGQDMKALQWHSDDPMTYAHVRSKAPIYRSTVSSAPVHNIWDHSCVRWKWCVEVEAGPSILCLQVFGDF